MEFIFRLSGYDDPSLDEETVRLLSKRLEARSREEVPGLWKVIDGLNAYAAKDSGREKRRRRYRIWGVILIALGIFVLVPGLVEPRTPVLIAAGVVGIVFGFLHFLPIGEKSSSAPAASCRREAAKLLSQRRGVDWSLPENRTELRFDGAGLSVLGGEKEDAVPYGEMTAVYETERLWLLLYSGEKALLLQKKDMTAGELEKFVPYLQENIGKQR